MLKSNFIVFLLGFFFLMGCENDENQEESTLPYFGNHDSKIVIDDNGNELIDTIYYTVPRFRFTNQDSITISHNDFEGMIYVADFFFTSCPTICPAKTFQLSTVQEKLKKADLFGSKVKFISHTVDVVHDTPAVLKQYAIDHSIDTENWSLVTGEQDYLYRIAEDGYLATAMIDDQEEGGFFHSDQFILIDTEKHIRGIYDGTDPDEVEEMWQDIQQLIANQNENEGK